MKSIISKFTKSSIISSFALVALAVLLITDSEATITGISYIIGAVLIAIGALAEINYLKNIKEKIADLDIIYGIVCVILGVLVITNPLAIEGVIPFIIGFIIIVNSTIKLQYSLELRKENNELWFSTLILSIVMTICGIVLIFNPFQGRDIVSTIVGIFILIYAVLDLISTFVIRNTFKKIQSAISEEIAKEQELLEENTVKEAKIEEEEIKEDNNDSEDNKEENKKNNKKKTKEGE